MKSTEVQRKIKSLNNRINKLHADIKNIQNECEHENLTYKYWGSSGNYDPSADVYGIDWRCQDCGKFWTTDQTNSWHLTKVVYPHAIDITRKPT